MFSTFLSSFNQTSRVESSPQPDLLRKIEPYATGFKEIMSNYAGATFENGLFRLRTLPEIPKWTKTVEETFVEFKGRLVCFGYDWLGRHFALEKKRTDTNQMLILLLEPGTGEAFEIPVSFSTFLNQEITEYRNEALASKFFQQWLDSGGAPPSHAECIGYKVPLYLGGTDTVENLELSDMDVYWSICAQTLNAKISS
jgi:hypothetical protein